MNEFILKIADNFGPVYLLFVLLLTLIISVIKKDYDSGEHGKTRILVGAVAFVLIIIFTHFDAKLGKLIIYSFATFGVFSFFGKGIEKGFLWLYEKVTTQKNILINNINSRLKR